MQVGFGIAACCAVGLHGACDDDGTAVVVEVQGEVVGGVGQCVGAVQYEDAVMLRQLVGDEVAPCVPVLGVDVCRVDEWVAQVPV